MTYTMKDHGGELAEGEGGGIKMACESSKTACVNRGKQHHLPSLRGSDGAGRASTVDAKVTTITNLLRWKGVCGCKEGD